MSLFVRIPSLLVAALLVAGCAKSSQSDGKAPATPAASDPAPAAVAKVPPRNLRSTTVVTLVNVGIYSPQAAQEAEKALAAVDWVYDVKVDPKARTVVYKAPTMDVAKDAYAALCWRGFASGDYQYDEPFTGARYGVFKKVGTVVFTEKPPPEPDDFTFKAVYVDCPESEKQIAAQFPGAKVTFSGTGPQKDVRVIGKPMSRWNAEETLNKAGVGEGGVGPRQTTTLWVPPSDDPNMVVLTHMALYCKESVQTVEQVLAKQPGVTKVTCEPAARTVRFQVPDWKAVDPANRALEDAGFATRVLYRPYEPRPAGNTFVKIGQAVNASGGTPLPPKGDSIVKVVGVHVGCPECEKVITGLFPDAKVTFSGTGQQKDVQVLSKDLKPWTVTWRLNQAGFGGKVQY